MCICGLRAKANTVLCVQSGKWIHSRCAGMKRVTAKFSRNLSLRNCKGSIVDAVEQEEKLCRAVKTVRVNISR